MSPNGSFSGAIRRAKERGEVPLICDIKPVSPKDGDLLQARGPAHLARSLEAAGACALSVVTEAKHFGGSLQMLGDVARASSLPVLRKDFLSAPDQMNESQTAGATAVLLILATVTDEAARSLHERARELGMEAVVEVHTREELDRALRLEPGIIGINNRDILAVETDSGDVRVTEELAPLVPDPVLVISESSLRSAADVGRALRAGADAVLIGTAVLQASDVRSCLAELMSIPAESR
jgi:indole-3-glycerol phosphate synthase